MDFTYKIVGGDGREYGPVSLDDLHEWIHAGRVDVTTPVLRSDLTAWKPADDYLELRFDLNQAAKNAMAGQDEAVPPVQDAPVIENAGFFPRFCAWVLDWFLLQTLLVLVQSFLGWKPPEPLTVEFLTSFAALKLLLLSAAISCAYYTLFIGLNGATPGKLMMGLRVVRASGEPVGAGIAMLRWASEFVSRLTLGIGYLMVIWHPERRALHDLIAGTKVVTMR